MPEPVSDHPERHEGIARAALLEVTPASSVGDFLDARVGEDGVIELRFAPTSDAYRGWSWVVSVAAIDDGGEPTVLELGLIPGEGALLAPEWVPWSVRLADWEAHQAELLAESGEAADDEDDLDDDADDDDEDADDADDDLDDDVDDDADDEDDEDELDEIDSDDDDSDDDEESDDVFDDDVDDEEPGARSTHSGDLDGIDIDVLDPDADEDDADADDAPDGVDTDDTAAAATDVAR